MSKRCVVKCGCKINTHIKHVIKEDSISCSKMFIIVGSIIDIVFEGTYMTNQQEKKYAF